MKKLLALVIILFGLNIQSFAEIRRLCKVKYETEDGWSKEYTLEVQFVTGKELNKKTKSFDYSSFSNYCLIWFGEGKVAISEITDFLSNVGDEFDHADQRKFYAHRVKQFGYLENH